MVFSVSSKNYIYVRPGAAVTRVSHENERERMVDQQLSPRSILFLSDNGLAYGLRRFSVYFLVYYCTKHAYCPDEFTV